MNLAESLENVRTRIAYNLLYRGDPARVPWEMNRPHPPLVDLVHQGDITVGRALDIGCGVGTQSIFLAQNGFQVDGIDFQAAAIDHARKRAEDEGLDIHFEVGDVGAAVERGPYDLIFDRGCFHSLSDGLKRAYADNVSQWLSPGGLLQVSAFTTISRLDELLPSPVPRIHSTDILHCFGARLQLVSREPVMKRAGLIPQMDVYLLRKPVLEA